MISRSLVTFRSSLWDTGVKLLEQILNADCILCRFALILILVLALLHHI